jgi:hypothetical protein
MPVRIVRAVRALSAMINKHESLKSPAPNTDQLRHAIDSGLTGDKVDFPDPAAAPLGTDSEAAGTSASPVQVQTAMHAELQGPRAKENQWSAAPVLYVGCVLLIAATGVVVAIYSI